MSGEREEEIKILRLPLHPKPFNHSYVKDFVREHGGAKNFLGRPPIEVLVVRNGWSQACTFELATWEENKRGKVSVGYTISCLEGKDNQEVSKRVA